MLELAPGAFISNLEEDGGTYSRGHIFKLLFPNRGLT